MLRTLAGLGMILALAAPAAADNFQRIEERERFLAVVEDRDLTRFAITVKVTGEGDIVGRAFGRNVTGDWEWRSGYFCRSILWGERDIGDNCQKVEVRDGTVRFTSDFGTGQFADLKIN